LIADRMDEIRKGGTGDAQSQIISKCPA
jgi:hypothetical protein